MKNRKKRIAVLLAGMLMASLPLNVRAENAEDYSEIFLMEEEISETEEAEEIVLSQFDETDTVLSDSEYGTENSIFSEENILSEEKEAEEDFISEFCEEEISLASLDEIEITNVNVTFHGALLPYIGGSLDDIFASEITVPDDAEYMTPDQYNETLSGQGVGDSCGSLWLGSAFAPEIRYTWEEEQYQSGSTYTYRFQIYAKDGYRFGREYDDGSRSTPEIRGMFDNGSLWPDYSEISEDGKILSLYFEFTIPQDEHEMVGLRMIREPFRTEFYYEPCYDDRIQMDGAQFLVTYADGETETLTFGKQDFSLETKYGDTIHMGSFPFVDKTTPKEYQVGVYSENCYEYVTFHSVRYTEDLPELEVGKDYHLSGEAGDILYYKWVPGWNEYCDVVENDNYAEEHGQYAISSEKCDVQVYRKSDGARSWNWGIIVVVDTGYIVKVTLKDTEADFSIDVHKGITKLEVSGYPDKLLPVQIREDGSKVFDPTGAKCKITYKGGEVVEHTFDANTPWVDDDHNEIAWMQYYDEQTQQYVMYVLAFFGGWDAWETSQLVRITEEEWRALNPAPQPQKIKATAKAVSVSVGQKTTVNTSGAQTPVTYKSSDKTIATVNAKTGEVTARKVGTVVITATAAASEEYKKATSKVTIKVVPAAAVKAAVSNVAAGMKISWSKVPDATGYVLYRNGKKIADIKNGSTVTYTDSAALKNGTKYTYKVTAYAATGTSKVSKSAFGYALKQPALSGVTNSTSKALTAKWGKTANVTGYQIKYVTGTKSVTLDVKGAGTVSKKLTGLVKGKTYKVSVRSYKTVSGVTYYSAWSSVKSAKVVK